MQNHNQHSPEVTIEDLARMVATGFKESRQDLLDFKAEVNGYFDKLEGRVVNIEGKVSNIEKNLADVNKRMATKDDIIRIEKHLGAIEEVTKNHGTKIRRIETKLQMA